MWNKIKPILATLLTLGINKLISFLKENRLYKPGK